MLVHVMRKFARWNEHGKLECRKLDMPPRSNWPHVQLGMEGRAGGGKPIREHARTRSPDGLHANSSAAEARRARGGIVPQTPARIRLADEGQKSRLQDIVFTGCIGGRKALAESRKVPDFCSFFAPLNPVITPALTTFADGCSQERRPGLLVTAPDG